MLIWFYSTTTNSAILTNTNVRGNTTNVAISDSGRFQNVIHFCFAQFFVVEKSRIGVNIGIETFVDDFALRMDLKGSAYIVLGISYKTLEKYCLQSNPCGIPTPNFLVYNVPAIAFVLFWEVR